MNNNNLRERAFTLGVELGYLTVTDSNSYSSIFKTGLNSKTENLTNIASKSAYFAKENGDYQSEYELLKQLLQLSKTSGASDITKQTLERLTQLANKHGNLTRLQKIRLKLDDIIILTMISYLILFPVLLTSKDIFFLNKEEKISFLSLYKVFKNTAFELIGSSSQISIQRQYLRSIWILILGSLITVITNLSTVDLTTMNLK